MSNKEEESLDNIRTPWMKAIVENTLRGISLGQLKNLINTDLNLGKCHVLYTAVVTHDEKLLIEVLKTGKNLDGHMSENKSLSIYNAINLAQLKFLMETIKKISLELSTLTKYDENGFNAFGKLDLNYSFESLPKYFYLLSFNHPRPHKILPLLHFVATTSYGEDMIKDMLEQKLISPQDLVNTDVFGNTPIDTCIQKMRYSLFKQLLDMEPNLPYLQQSGSIIKVINHNWSKSSKYFHPKDASFWDNFLMNNQSPIIEKEINAILYYPLYSLSNKDNSELVKLAGEVYNSLSKESVERISNILEVRNLKKEVNSHHKSTLHKL